MRVSLPILLAAVLLLAPWQGSADQASTLKTAALASAGNLGRARMSIMADARSVLVVGDSLSIYLGEQLKAHFSRQPGLAFAQLSKVSSGLARPGFFNWETTLDGLVRQHKPDLVLIMFGANDPQAMRTPSGVNVRFATQAWDSEYSRRVQRLIDICRASVPRARVFWVGTPVMGRPELDEDIQHINTVVQAQLHRNAETWFIETRDVLADEYGRYAKSLPLPSGKIARVRADDGVHVTHAGASLLTGRCIESMYAAHLAAPGFVVQLAPDGQGEAHQELAGLGALASNPEQIPGFRPDATGAVGATEMAAAPGSAAVLAEEKVEEGRSGRAVEKAASYNADAVASLTASRTAAPVTVADGGEYRFPIRRTTKVFSRHVSLSTASGRSEAAAQQLANSNALASSEPSPTRAEAMATAHSMMSTEMTAAAGQSVFGVQESSWRQSSFAERRAAALRRKGLQTRVVGVDLGDRGVWHRVVIGAVDSFEGARALQAQLSERFQLKDTVILKSS